MWPFNESDSKQSEFACDGQDRHEYETLEEMEMVAVSKHYDPQEDGFVVITRTIPKFAECGVCGDTIENSMAHWDDRLVWSSYADYDETLTKIIVDDCSDAARTQISEDDLYE